MSAHGIRSTWRPAGDAAEVRVEDVYDTGIDDLWDAVTSPERLARWIAVVEGDPVLGGTVTARFTSHWEGTGVIEVCDAPHRLRVRWDGDDSVMTAELSADGDRTRLVITDRGIPVDEVTHHTAGWHVHFEDLASVVAGREPGGWEARWRELIPQYVDQGPTA
jgi:uncharacterized protein YndB with AHSA1/START domain